MENNEILLKQDAPAPEAARPEAPNKSPLKRFLLPLCLKNVTAFLCILVVIFAVFAFFGSEPMAVINSGNGMVDQIKAEIANYETQIDSFHTAIDECGKRIENLEAQLPDLAAAMVDAEAAIAPAQEIAATAEAALDEVCSRNTYSSYYCTEDCKPFHDEFSTAYDALTELQKAADVAEIAYSSCEKEIAQLKENINDYNDDIAQYQEYIQLCKEDISELRGRFVGQWFALFAKVAAMLLCIGGLCLLVKLLIAKKQPKKCLLMACGAVGIGAVLFLLITIIVAKLKGAALLLNLLVSPYSYTAFAMAMFARILMKKAKKPVVCRTAAIVAAVLAGFFGIALLGAYGSLSAVLAALLFAVAVICLAFVIEPLVFTEYLNIAKHIFLSLITCGIWTLVWIYHVTKNLNKVERVEERTPRNELLLCMFLLFFFPYWAFKTAEYVEVYGEEKGKSFSLEVLALVFAFICPIFSTVMIQNKINVIVGKTE